MKGLELLNSVVDVGPDGIRGFISEFEKLAATQEQVEIPVVNYFSPGIYAREMKMKAGGLVVGKIHRFENMNVLSEGEVSVLSPEGVMRLKAPATFVAPAGTKRVIYAHSDCTWTVFHGTDERDLEKIEAQFIAKSFNDLNPVLPAEEKKCLG